MTQGDVLSYANEIYGKDRENVYHMIGFYGTKDLVTTDTLLSYDSKT